MLLDVKQASQASQRPKMSDVKMKEEKFVLENGKLVEKIFFLIDCLSIFAFVLILEENFEMLKALYEFQAVYPKTIRLHALTFNQKLRKLIFSNSVVALKRTKCFCFIRHQRGKGIGGKSLTRGGTLASFLPIMWRRLK